VLNSLIMKITGKENDVSDFSLPVIFIRLFNT